jgi:hypothetical protein
MLGTVLNTIINNVLNYLCSLHSLPVAVACIMKIWCGGDSPMAHSSTGQLGDCFNWSTGLRGVNSSTPTGRQCQLVESYRNIWTTCLKLAPVGLFACLSLTGSSCCLSKPSKLALTLLRPFQPS